jgi:gp16 family phage-associated protein
MTARKSVSHSAVTTPESAKQALYAKGMTLTTFASKNGFKYRTVSEVVRGVNKGLYGEGHRVAVALGIK